MRPSRSSPGPAPRRSAAQVAFALASLLGAGLGATPAARAEPHDYAIDPVHTRIVFFVDHAGFSQAIGTFSGISGGLRYDADDPAASRIEARIPIASLDLGDREWTKAILGGRFFKAERYPQARFVSSAVRAGEDGRLEVVGDLKLRGVERQIVLAATVNADHAHPMTFKRTLGASAHTELARADFRLGAYPGVVGARVQVRIELEAIRLPPGQDAFAAHAAAPRPGPEGTPHDPADSEPSEDN